MVGKINLDGADAIRWCNRCRESVPISEWRLESRLGIASVVHVGPMRGILDGDPGICRYREKVPVKVNG